MVAVSEGGLFLLSSRTSRQVRPEFGLPIYEIFDMKAGLPTYEILDMKACRITTLFWGRGEGRGGGRRRRGVVVEGRGRPLCCLFGQIPDRIGTLPDLWCLRPFQAAVGTRVLRVLTECFGPLQGNRINS